MSTLYHLEMDRGSEYTNKTIVQAIRYLVDQDQKGHSLRVIPPLAPLPVKVSKDKKTAHNIIEQLQKDAQEAQDNLLATKVHQAYHANEWRAEEENYKVGDLVILTTKHCHKEYKQKGKKHIAKFMP
ncbi:hypothetical protein C0995_004414 [Termitomyces sp. Mi166|nr:hypothetical protein C0995_004414 [Termitomyces sp. Mi166\